MTQSNGENVNRSEYCKLYSATNDYISVKENMLLPKWIHRPVLMTENEESTIDKEKGGQAVWSFRAQPTQ